MAPDAAINCVAHSVMGSKRGCDSNWVQERPWLPRRNDALCDAVDALFREWKQTGSMARVTNTTPFIAHHPAWDVHAVRQMVLLDAHCKAVWEDGDPSRVLKANDALSHAVRAGINKVFGVEQVPARNVGRSREALKHLQSCTSSEARVWVNLHLSQELRASWQATQRKTTPAQPAPGSGPCEQRQRAPPRGASSTARVARWLESEDVLISEGASRHGSDWDEADATQVPTDAAAGARLILHASSGTPLRSLNHGGLGGGLLPHWAHGAVSPSGLSSVGGIDRANPTPQPQLL